MNWGITYSAGLILAAFSSASLAQEVSIVDEVCPSRITTTQAIVTVPQGFSASSLSVATALKEVLLTDGLPSSSGFMAPDEIQGETGVITIRSWRFRNNVDRPVYVSCVYDNTTVTLLLKLDPAVTKCVVTTDASVAVGGKPKVVSSSCR